MSEFTPGPWSEHGKGGCSCGQIFGPDGNAVICMVFGPGNVGDEGPDCFPNKKGQQANARLIAAAPELYDALRQCETVMMIVRPRSHTKEYLACLDQARAAIAKALEETPEPTTPMSDRIASALNRTWPGAAVVILTLTVMSCLPVEWLWFLA